MLLSCASLITRRPPRPHAPLTPRSRLAAVVSEEVTTEVVAAAMMADRREDGRRVQWVFLGCHGVGNGTYTVRLSRLIGVHHITTGDLVRDALASQAPLSKQLCSLVPLQRCTKSLSTLQRSSLVEKSRQKPQERMSVLSDVLKRSSYDTEPMLKECGISIAQVFT